MSEEFDIFFRIFDSLGTFGLLGLIVFAFFKGWVTPSSIQTKIDLLNNNHFNNINSLNDNRLKEIVALHNQLHAIQQKRIEDLETLAKERAVRVEQGVQMLSTFIDAQDKLSRLADHLKRDDNGQ